ncbi:MAG: hypothetical protein JSS49_25865 [Planctomycetes bacterium]|nr:hypothetical protein [Planctomycetota bacterium]
MAGDRVKLCDRLAVLEETQRTGLAEQCLALYTCISDFAGPSGKDRRAHATLSVEQETLLQRVLAQEYVDWRVPRWCSGLLVLAVCDQKTLSGYVGAWLHSDLLNMPHRVLQVLNDRRPPWLPAFVRKQVKQKDYCIVSWSVERGLIRSGAIAPSDDEDYVNRFATGVPGYVGMRSPIEVRTDSLSDLPESISDVLLADPDLLNDVWRLFEAQNSGLERQETGWYETLKEFAEQGRLDRHRLIHASISALLRPARPAAQSGFAKFHEYLELTLDERAELWSDYVPLFANGSTSAAVAVAASEVLAKGKRLNAASFLEACHPVFQLDKKVVPGKVLKLIKRLVKEQPDCRGAAVTALIAGLNNVSPDVQEESLDLLETLADHLNASTRNELLAAAEHVAAALRSRIETLAAKSPAQTAESMISPKNDSAPRHSASQGRKASSCLPQIEALSPRLRTISGVDAAADAISQRLDPIPPQIESRFAPRRDPSQVVIPLASVDELIDAVSAFVEGCNEAMDVERILDGISRFHRDKPAGFEQRVAPLKKRIEARSDPFADTVLSAAINTGVPQLIREWLGMPAISVQWGEWYEMSYRFFRTRIREISYRLQPNDRIKPGLPLLSLPTHRGGWIDPVVLVERIATYAREKAIVSNNVDIAQALLRLSPDGCEQAKQAIACLKAEQKKDDWYTKNSLNALEFALGEPVELSWASRGLNYETRCLAAAHARAALGHPCDPPLPFTVPNATLDEDGSIRFVGPITNDAAFPGGLLLQAHSWDAAFPERESWGSSGTATRNWMVDWQNMVWPNNRAVACLLSIQFGHVPDSLNNLLDPDWTWTDEACRLAAWAMGTESADCKLRVTDAIVFGTSQRTFDPTLLGRHLATILEKLKLNRVAAVLAEAARVSPLHQWTVFTILDSTLSHISTVPRDLHHLLTPLLETATLLGRCVNDSSRAFLSSITGSTKTAKLAQQILAVSLDPQPMIVVRDLALSASLDRAERWGRPWT